MPERPEGDMTPSPTRSAAPHVLHDPLTPALSHLVVHIGALRPTLLRAGRLLVEAALVPTVIIAVLLHTAGLSVALLTALAWCYAVAAVRWWTTRQLPGTLLLCTSMFSGRVLIALATSSAFVYLLQPVVGSVVMAALFMGSAAVGRPVTVRLARDFVHLPAHVLDRRGVRRMFSQVALLWGTSRLVDAGMNLSFLHAGVDMGLIARGLFSPVLTLVTVALCTAWGWRALRRDGVLLRLGAPVAAVA